MPFSAAVGDVLRASVADGRLDRRSLAAAWSPDRPAELLGAAFHHGVSGYLWRAAQDADAPADFLQRLEAVRGATVAHHLRTVIDLQHLAGVLDASGVDWMVVKGPVLAEAYHGGPDLRGYSDLDVLVPPPQLEAALEALTSSGSEVLDRNWALLHREAKGEVHLRLPHGSPLDLHWHLLNGRDAREAFPLDVAGVFERAVTVELAGLQVRTLDAVDTLAYLALHTMLSGAERLIWLKDIERVAVRGQIDPDALAGRARQWRAGLVLAAALQLVASTLDVAPLPDLASPRGLGQRAWLAIAAAQARRAPVPRADGRGSVYATLVKSLRPTVAASTGMLLARVTANQLQKVGRRRVPRTPDGRIDPRHPASDRFEAGGTAARHAFLQRVSQHGR